MGKESCSRGCTKKGRDNGGFGESWCSRSGLESVHTRSKGALSGQCTYSLRGMVTPLELRLLVSKAKLPTNGYLQIQPYTCTFATKVEGTDPFRRPAPGLVMHPVCFHRFSGARERRGRRSNGRPKSGQWSNGRPKSGRRSNGQPKSGRRSNGRPKSGRRSNGRLNAGGQAAEQTAAAGYLNLSGRNAWTAGACAPTGLSSHPSAAPCDLSLSHPTPTAHAPDLVDNRPTEHAASLFQLKVAAAGGGCKTASRPHHVDQSGGLRA